MLEIIAELLIIFASLQILEHLLDVFLWSQLVKVLLICIGIVLGVAIWISPLIQIA